MAQRDFLIATSANDVALTRLIAAAAAATGFMKGAPGGPLPGWHQVGIDNRAFLQTILDRAAQAYPHAGAPYYAARLWNGLNWQPAYIAFLSVHLHGAVPDFSSMAQSRQNLDIDGYRLLPGPQWTGSVEEMISKAGRALREMGDAMLAEINALTKLKRVPAQRLLADRIVELSARLRHFRPETSVEEQKEICARWLEALGLRGQGDLEITELGDGRKAVIRVRKGCCLDYLAFPDTYCASCPKQDDAVRLARLRANAIAELDAAT